MQLYDFTFHRVAMYNWCTIDCITLRLRRPYNQETVPMSPDPSPRGDLGLGIWHAARFSAGNIEKLGVAWGQGQALCRIHKQGHMGHTCFIHYDLNAVAKYCFSKYSNLTSIYHNSCTLSSLVYTDHSIKSWVRLLFEQQRFRVSWPVVHHWILHRGRRNLSSPGFYKLYHNRFSEHRPGCLHGRHTINVVQRDQRSKVNPLDTNVSITISSCKYHSVIKYKT